MKYIIVLLGLFLISCEKSSLSPIPTVRVNQLHTLTQTFDTSILIISVEPLLYFNPEHPETNKLYAYVHCKLTKPINRTLAIHLIQSLENTDNEVVMVLLSNTVSAHFDIPLFRLNKYEVPNNIWIKSAYLYEFIN